MQNLKLMGNQLGLMIWTTQICYSGCQRMQS